MCFYIFTSKYEDEDKAIYGTERDYALDITYKTQSRKIFASNEKEALAVYIKNYTDDMNVLFDNQLHIHAIVSPTSM